MLCVPVEVHRHTHTHTHTRYTEYRAHDVHAIRVHSIIYLYGLYIYVRRVMCEIIRSEMGFENYSDAHDNNIMMARLRGGPLILYYIHTCAT